MKLAVVGSGVSGLVAAYLLHRQHDLTLFEAADYVGGHSNTVVVDDGARALAVDTGFIVYNEWTYPNFCALLSRLGVATQPSNMSFAVRDDASGLEYRGDNLNTLFAQRRNVLRPSFLRMLVEIVRFYRGARALLRDGADETRTLGEHLKRERYSSEFVEQHLIPMGAAIWSADPEQFREFPAARFARFCFNHGMLNVFRRPRWRTISGGSQRYVELLTAGFRDRIRLRTPVLNIRRSASRVDVETPQGVEPFDAVVLAVHSDQALALLADPSPEEREILGAMPYHANDCVLHTDARLLPRAPRARASWNYLVRPQRRGAATMTYYMNLLQDLPTQTAYCLTLNCSDLIDPACVRYRTTYHHPVFTVRSVAAQKRWPQISGVNRTHYCGAYWGYGFHEDGVNSALAVCRQFGVSLADAP